MIRVTRAGALAALCALACACSGASEFGSNAGNGAMPPAAHPVAGSTSTLAAYWESWDDTNPTAQFGPLLAMPVAVTIVDVADFEIRNGHGKAFEGPYNAHSLAPGAAAIHARGGKVFLSIGGYSSQWGVGDSAALTRALARVLAANPGVFDGFDFDDENIPWQDATPQAGQTEIVRSIEAVHARWPAKPISYTAFVMGADLPVRWSDDQGEDVAVLRQIGGIVAFVNVMEYTQYANGRVWKPSAHPNCEWNPDARDDCYRDTLGEFAALPLAGGGRLGAARVVMGLEVRPEQPKPPMLMPAQMGSYATWLRESGYAGVSLWSIDRDRRGVSGYARGAFVSAIARAPLSAF